MASSGEGIPLDDMKQGGKSQGEEGKRTNNTDKPDESKSEASQAQSEGNSVHPETSNTETETRDAPNKAASPPSPTPAEDDEEFSEDQQKKPCGETSVIPIDEAGDETLLQQKEHGSTQSSGDPSSSGLVEQDDGAAQEDQIERTPKDGRDAQMEEELRSLREKLAKQEKEHEILMLEKEADKRSITEVKEKLESEEKKAQVQVKQLLDKIVELHKTNGDKDNDIDELREGIQAHEEIAENIMKKIELEVNKNSRLESSVANWKEDYSKLHKEKTRMNEELKIFKSQVSNQKTTMEGYQTTIKKIRKENEDSKQQCDKEYKKLKEEKEKNEKQFGKDRTKLTLKNSELEATMNNKRREHEAECKRLNETISKGTQQLNQYYAAYTQSVTKFSQLEADVQKLKLENHGLQTYKNICPELKQQITSLRKTIQDLENQKEDLMLRLSKIAGANLTYNNPNIADLSDEKRPTKLAEEFSELYDNEWTDAFEEAEAVDDKSRTMFLFDVLKRASEYCTDLSTGHDDAIKSSFTTLKYELTVPITESAVYTSNDTSKTTKAEKVDKQENDEGTTTNAIEAGPMDNDDTQDHDDLPRDDKKTKDEYLDTPKDNNQDTPKDETDDDEFVHVEDALVTNAMNATNDSSKNKVGTDANTDVGTDQGKDTPEDNGDEISKSRDEQSVHSTDTSEGEHDGSTAAGDGTNTTSVNQTEEGKKTDPNGETKETPGAKDDEPLNPQDQATNQGGVVDIDPASGDEAKESGTNVEDMKGDDAEDASSQKDGKTTPIDNHDDTVEGEKDDASVDGPDKEGSTTLEGNNAAIDTKFEGDGANTDPPTNRNAETINETNGNAQGTSVDEIKGNSGQHGKDKTETKIGDNHSEINPQGEEKRTDVDQTANGNTNATDLQSEDTNQSSADTHSGNKHPTKNTIEISKIDFNFDDLSKEQLKMIMDLKKLCEVQQSNDVKSNGARIIADAMNVSEESKEMMKYILKCIDICWSMHRHEPPVHINFPSHVDGQPFDKGVYRPYTKSGKQLDFVVWPSLHLHKDGPMLSKGVAQGK